MNLSKLVNLLTSALFFHSLRCTLSSSLITLSRPALTSRLKIATTSYYHSAPVSWNDLPFDLCHVAHHVTPSPINCLPDAALSSLTQAIILSGSVKCVATSIQWVTAVEDCEYTVSLLRTTLRIRHRGFQPALVKSLLYLTLLYIKLACL